MNKQREPSLWRLAVPPTIWAAHFLGCYAAAAISCEKAGTPAKTEILALTALAAAGLAWSGGRGLARARPRAPALDSAEGRLRFLGRAELWLSALSLAAVVMAAGAAVLAGSCR